MKSESTKDAMISNKNNYTGGIKFNVRKITLGLVGLCLISSCAFKSTDGAPKNNSETSILQASVVVNGSGDGIPDETKSALGLNPSIAYFPRLSVFLVKEITLGAIFKERSNLVEVDEDYLMLTQQYASTSADKGGDLDLLKVLRKKILINQYKFLRNIRAEERDTITDEDLKSSVLSNWEDGQYYGYRKALGLVKAPQDNISGKFSTNFKIKIRSSKGVTQVSNVKLKSFYYDFKNLKLNDIYSHYLKKDTGAKETIDLSTSNNEYVPATNYYIFADEIKNTDIQKRINERNEIGLEFEDFDYKVAGIDLNYSKVISSIIDKCAKIVISDGTKTEIFYISPIYNLAEALKILGKDFVQNKDGSIDSLGNLQTGISQPIDFDSLKSSDLSKGVWSIFGESDNMGDQLKAKGFYFISFASMKDLLNANKREIKLSENKNDSQINIERVLWGDELTIKINSLTRKIMNESISVTEHEPVCSGGGCNFTGDDFTRGSECRCTQDCNETYSSPSIAGSSVDLTTIKISDFINIADEYGNPVKFDVFSFENTIIVKFNYQLAQLKNKLSISFINPEDREYSVRSGRVASTCSGISPSYSNVQWKNKYEFNHSDTIIGALKY